MLAILYVVLYNIMEAHIIIHFVIIIGGIVIQLYNMNLKTYSVSMRETVNLPNFHTPWKCMKHDIHIHYAHESRSNYG